MAHQQKLKNDGWQRVSVWLPPSYYQALRAISATEGVSMQEGVRTLIRSQIEFKTEPSAA